MRSGVVSGASRVDSEVMPTENATSPLQRKLMMFEETPPGLQPTRMSPTAISFGKFRRCVSPSATSGMIENCDSEPMAMSMGCETRTLKSSFVSVMPIVSMMMPSTVDCRLPRTQANSGGNVPANVTSSRYVTTATAAMNHGVSFASQAEILCASFMSARPGLPRFHGANAAVRRFADGPDG